MSDLPIGMVFFISAVKGAALWVLVAIIFLMLRKS
jgi:hypothetical protein